MTKTLVLIRHAHRDIDNRLKDNGLSARGFDQVKKLVKFYINRFEGAKPILYSSPKKRCQETITPIAKEAAVKYTIDERLDEHAGNENTALFMARMEEFLDVWKYEGPALTVLCSHGDWIPIAVQKLTGRAVDLKKCGWIEIEYNEGADATLTWIVQKHY